MQPKDTPTREDLLEETTGVSHKPWAEGRGNPAGYYESFGLTCCDVEAFSNWFKRAEASDSPCRILTHFCNDCLPAYRADMASIGLCVAEETP